MAMVTMVCARSRRTRRGELFAAQTDSTRNFHFCAGILVDDHEFERLLTSNHRLFLICIINSWAQTLYLYLLYLYTLRILELFLTFRPFTALITVDSPVIISFVAILPLAV